MEAAYRALWRAAWPAVRWYVRRKDRRRCVDAIATSERFGCHQKPNGWDSDPNSARPWTLWIHGASVGECLSALPLLEFALSPRLPVDRPKRVVITTTTAAARQLLRRRLSAVDIDGRAVCVFAPLDAPFSVAQFYDTWQPDAGLWIESELWPTLIFEAKRRQIPIGIINGRISERSTQLWSLPFVAPFTRRMMANFSLVLCQDDKNQARLFRLGARNPEVATNLKFATRGQQQDLALVSSLQTSIGNRPVWLAASTHEGEEALLSQVHSQLSQAAFTGEDRPLLVIIPRHPERTSNIVEVLRQKFPSLTVETRSNGEHPTSDCDVFVVQTMGETTLFFDAIPTVVVGGTLVPRGGHNPIEPLRSGCRVIVGPHTFNFRDIIAQLQQCGNTLITEVSAPEQLAQHLITHLHRQPRHDQATQSLMQNLSVQAMSTYERALVQWLAREQRTTSSG